MELEAYYAIAGFARRKQPDHEIVIPTPSTRAICPCARFCWVNATLFLRSPDLSPSDTLLLELSYKNNTWPRAATNDQPFLDQFPFLAEPSRVKAGPHWGARGPSYP